VNGQQKPRDPGILKIMLQATS